MVYEFGIVMYTPSEVPELDLVSWIAPKRTIPKLIHGQRYRECRALPLKIMPSLARN